MKISVIIPVYNSKPYLERCVKSVLNQTYKDIEIILVDDGSTDGSGELCDELASCHSLITSVHQENQGLSGARNTGIRHARGEYIAFLDSDDEWLLDDGLEKILQERKPNDDLIVFKNVHIWNGNKRVPTNDYDLDRMAALPDAESIFSHLVTTQQFRMSACFLLVRRQLLIDHDIVFPEGFISEDVFWSLHLWQCVKTVTLLNLNFYGYYHRSNSITTSPSLRVYESYDKIFTYWKQQCNNGCSNAAPIRIYLADMWASRGYAYYLLKSSERPIAYDILRRHADLLRYAATPKARRAAKMAGVLGTRITVAVLGCYWLLRNKIK